ncbi:hypothetical protein COV13_00915 [Candidatus Woesearchaeota archaeon CG10_big_fil_rev_8_21_14_0_10_32_9]|nr:MAG: hypothetical protein COV13_00915 [Candidatus Woesearchaeota archaeon CG10_big_fil_rev_8_21_14_0_10_32_9]
MADKKDEFTEKMEKNIKELERRTESYSNTLKTLDTKHQYILTKNLMKHLGGEGTDELNFSLLSSKSNPKGHEKLKDLLAKDITKDYETAVLNELKSSVEGDIKGIKNDKFLKKLTKKFYNVNGDYMRNLIYELEDEFTPDTYKKFHIDSHKKQVAQELEPDTYSHIKKTDIPSLLKYIGAEKHLDNVSKLASLEYLPMVKELILNSRKSEDGKRSIDYQTISAISKDFKKNKLPDLEAFLKQYKQAA